MAEKAITELEAAAIEKLRVELQEPQAVASRVLNLISPLINLPADRLPKDLIVRSLLLQRVQNDLRCCSILAERGYSLQAAALAAGIFEGFATIGAITDDADANKWLAHDKEEAGFGSIRKLTSKSFEKIAGNSKGADRIYAMYRQLCMAKHLNPIVERSRGYRIEGKRLTFEQGPDAGTRAVQQAWFALERGSQGAFLAVVAFINDDRLPLTPELRAEIDATRRELNSIQARSVHRWPKNYTTAEK